LLVISDRRQARRPLDELAEEIFAGGCRWFSLREKDLPAAERRALLGALVTLGRRWEATVAVHEDIDAAVMAAAGGVHLPSGGSPRTARARLPGGLIGASAHSAEEAAALLRSGADYVTVSPVFATASKPGYGPILGVSALGTLIRGAAIPVIALGGVTEATAADCRAAGAAGIAVMGQIMRAADPRGVTAAFVAALQRASTSTPLSPPGKGFSE